MGVHENLEEMAGPTSGGKDLTGGKAEGDMDYPEGWTGEIQ